MPVLDSWQQEIAWKEKAARAFARTSPHPAHPGVRLTENPEDIAAIFVAGVKAVELVRQYPPDVLDALLTIDTRLYGQGRSLPYHNIFSPVIPVPVRDDILKLDGAFEKAAGLKAKGYLVSKSQLHETPLYKDMESVGRPHTDGYAVRMIVSYTLDPGLMTEWYPVEATETIVGKLNDDLRAAPESAVPAVKQGYGCQQVSWGHVLVLKGRRLGRADEQLVHNGALPKKGTFGLVYQAGF